jgi:hypothetical protein
MEMGRFSESILMKLSVVVQGRLNMETAKFGKKLLGEGNIMAVLRRLDRLTQEEAQVTVAQTLEVVQGLVSNMKVVMDGASDLKRFLYFLTFF